MTILMRALVTILLVLQGCSAKPVNGGRPMSREQECYHCAPGIAECEQIQCEPAPIPTAAPAVKASNPSSQLWERERIFKLAPQHDPQHP